MTPSDADTPPQPVVTRSLREALMSLPHGVFEGANRYDTDNMHVLHLWVGGKSYDIQVRRLDIKDDGRRFHG